MKTLMDGVNKGREKRFTEAEVRNALARMQDDNQVMVADDIIFLIWAQTAERKWIMWTLKSKQFLSVYVLDFFNRVNVLFFSL